MAPANKTCDFYRANDGVMYKNTNWNDLNTRCLSRILGVSSGCTNTLPYIYMEGSILSHVGENVTDL